MKVNPFRKVYSAQYMIRFMMMIPLSQISAVPKRRRDQIMVMFIILGIFSMINGNFTYRVMTDPIYAGSENIGIIVDVLKNISHILLTVLLIRTFCEHIRGTDTGSSEIR